MKIAIAVGTCTIHEAILHHMLHDGAAWAGEAATVECAVMTRDVEPCTAGIAVESDYDVNAAASTKRFADKFEVQLSGEGWTSATQVGSHSSWCTWNRK